MWGWVHRLLGGGWHRPGLSIERLSQLVRQLDGEQASLEDAAFRRNGQEILAALHNKCTQVARDAGGYPDNPIRGDVWIDGASLAPVAERLAQLLRARGATDLERQAHVIRCRAVLAVQSHYHDVVGPAMLSRADCEERLGETAAALACYDAVVDDFSFIVEECEAGCDGPGRADRASLECLGEAILRRRALSDQPVLEALGRRVAALLERAPAAGPST